LPGLAVGAGGDDGAGAGEEGVELVGREDHDGCEGAVGGAFEPLDPRRELDAA